MGSICGPTWTHLNKPGEGVRGRGEVLVTRPSRCDTPRYLRRQNNRVAPGRFAALHLGTDEAEALARRIHRSRQHARHGSDRAVEPKLAQAYMLRDVVGRERAERDQQREGDRQVEMRAFDV